MSDIYDCVRRAAKTVLLASEVSILAFGCSSDSQNPAQSYSVAEQERLDNFYRDFNAFIVDGYLSEKEQNVLYSELESFANFYSQSVCTDKDLCSIESRLSGKDLEEFRDLLNENLNDYDVLTPEVEKKLKKLGYDVSVQSLFSKKELEYVPEQIFIATILLLLMGGAFLRG